MNGMSSLLGFSDSLVSPMFAYATRATVFDFINDFLKFVIDLLQFV